jgi:cell division control protein 6
VKGGGGKRTFGRSASFGGAGARGCVSGVVKIAEGVRVDEVLRGLGVGDRDQETKNVREEEMCVIWEKERARIGRDGKVLEGKMGAKGKGKGGDVFMDAMED